MTLPFLTCHRKLGKCKLAEVVTRSFLHEQLDVNGLPKAAYMNLSLFCIRLSFPRLEVYIYLFDLIHMPSASGGIVIALYSYPGVYIYVVLLLL